MNVSFLLDRTSYCGGQTAVCYITFSNEQRGSTSGGSLSRSVSDSPMPGRVLRGGEEEEVVSLAAAQYHVEAQYDDSFVRIVRDSSPRAPRAFGLDVISKKERASEVLWACRPAVVASDLVVARGNARTFAFKVPLPVDVPPSFRGVAVRYVHVITVTVQQASPTPRVWRLTVPVQRVESGLPLASPPAAPSGTAEVLPVVVEVDREGALRAGPTQCSEDLINKVVRVREFVQHSPPSSFRIESGGELVAKFSIARKVVPAGGVVTGVFSFEGASVACFCVTMDLVSVEEVNEGAVLVLDDQKGMRKAERMRRVRDSCSTIAAEYVEFAATVEVPHDATPTMSTDFTMHSWHLEVEFLTCAHGVPLPPPDDVVADRLLWRLPVTVVSDCRGMLEPPGEPVKPTAL